MLDADVKEGMMVRYAQDPDSIMPPYFGQVHGVEEKTEDSTTYEIRDYTCGSCGSMCTSSADTPYMVWYAEASEFEPKVE